VVAVRTRARAAAVGALADQLGRRIDIAVQDQQLAPAMPSGVD